MINTTNNYKTAIKASKRQIKAKAELFSGSSLVNTYTENDALKSITVERVGEDSKFFGFGVTHKFNIKLIDVARAINLTTDNYFKVYLGTEGEYITYPKAHITEVNRDENTNELSITAYDVLKDTKTATVNDLGLQAPYTIQDVVKASSELLGCNKYIKESKNLLNIGSVTFTRAINYNDLKIPAGTYTFSAKITSNDTDSDKSRAYFYKDGNLVTFINLSRNTRNSVKFTLTSDADRISLFASYDNAHSTDDTATYENVQLEKGSVATEYEPYYKTEVIYTGSNLFNAKLIPETTGIVVNGDGSQITMPVVSSGNGSKKIGIFKDFAPNIKVGDIVYLSFDRSVYNDYNNFIYLIGEEEIIWSNGGYKTITQQMLDSNLYLYGNRFVSGETEQINLNNFRMVLGKTNKPFEPYNTAFEIEYTDGANFEGTETLEEVLRAAAEATQTIYFINNNDALVFKRLGGEAASITKDNYFTLDSKTNKRLQTICSATELGDNVSVSTSMLGSTQYLRDNPFLELREDIATILDNAIAAVGNITINQFSCEWRGDPSLEVGDKLELTTKDNDKVISYLLNDSLVYDGSLKQKTEWNYTDGEEAESTPTTLGEALKQTRAKVDKVNKEISLIVSETSANTEQLSGLTTRASGIEATVSEIKTTQETAANTLEIINNDITTLTNTVNAKMSAEDVKIEIQKEMSNGATSVKTSTGFTFNDQGLTIAKDGSEMTTNVDEDGISVYRDGEEVLTADNKGVVAYDLHAKTYLIVGTNSRFEDYEKDGEPRTGCFWIGETEVE